jgi:hypothetical protein
LKYISVRQLFEIATQKWTSIVTLKYPFRLPLPSAYALGINTS